MQNLFEKNNIKTKNEDYYFELLSIFSNQSDANISLDTEKINKILQKNKKRSIKL